MADQPAVLPWTHGALGSEMTCEMDQLGIKARIQANWKNLALMVKPVV